MSDYTVHHISADEYAEEIRGMHKDVFKSDAPAPELEVGDWWIVLFQHDTPAGFAALVPSIAESKAGYLYRCGVLSAHRGNHLQTRLIRAREMRARKLGWSALRTDTSYDNIASSNNLIRAGYKLFTPAVPWSFKDALYWRKAL